MTVRRVVLLCLLIAGRPMVHAQGIQNDPGPAETTLYVHTVSGHELVLNTQEPHPEPTVGGSPGAFTTTQTCVDVPGVGDMQHGRAGRTSSPRVTLVVS